MMKYELCKLLKDAGFPQEGKHGGAYPRDGEFIYSPSLEELIEACGDRFVLLGRYSNGTWFCGETTSTYDGGYPIDEISVGSTPKEAVANLWLSLNKNQ